MMVIKNRFLLVSVLLSLAVAAVVCVMRGPCSVEHEPAALRVGMMSGWAPFMSLGPTGSFEGFDVDVANELGKRLGKEVQILDLGSLPPCFLSLEQGRVDLVMSGLDSTQERMAKWNMVRYTGQEVQQFMLLFWQQVPEGVQTLDDVSNSANAVVCVEQGSAQERFAQRCQGLNLKQLLVPDMPLDLEAGKSVAALVEPRVAARLMRLRPQLKALPVPLPQDFCVYGEGIVVRKDNAALATQVEQAIAQMRADGTMAALEERWFKDGNAA